MRNPTFMKYVLPFLIVAFLVSCGNQKMRFSRIQSSTQVVVSVDETDREDHKNKSSIPITSAKQAPEEATTIDSSQSPHDSQLQTDMDEGFVVASTTSTKAQNKTISPTRGNSNEEKLSAALETEKNSKKALVWLAISLFGLFAFILPGIIFFVIGSNRYLQAKTAQYNTENGVENLRIAKVFFIIDLVLVFIFVLGIIAFVITNL